MNAFDNLLKACMQIDKSPNRRASLFSVSCESGSTSSLFAQMEKKLDNLVQTVSEIPCALEETFDEIVHNVIDIPTTLEETFDELVDAFNEKFSIRPKERPPCVRVTIHDFQEIKEEGKPKSLVLKNGLNYQQLLDYLGSDTEDNVSESFFNESTLSFSIDLEETSEEEKPPTPDDDWDIYLMSLTSPGLKTPQSSPRISVVCPKQETPAEYASETMNPVDALLSEGPCDASVEILDTFQGDSVNLGHPLAL